MTQEKKKYKKINQQWNFQKLNFLIAFCMIVSCFSFQSKVSAQVSNQINLIIAPEIFELQLEKGEVYEGKIKIYNKGEAPIPLEAVISNFDAEEFSGTATFSDGFSENSEQDDILFNPSKWMKIENPNFILDSKETVNIKFSISVPQKAELGGYYTVVFFEPKIFASGNSNQGTSAISVVPIVGTPLLISVGKREKRTNTDFMTVSEFSIPEKFHIKRLENSVINITGLFSKAYAETMKTFSIVQSGQLQFNLHIKNNDTYHIKPSGKLTIFSSSGKIIGETEIKKITILPGKTRDIPVEFTPIVPATISKLPNFFQDIISKNLFFGKFHASLVLDVDGISQKDEIEFWIFPWKSFFAIFFILAILFMGRKRIRQAIRALIRKK